MSSSLVLSFKKTISLIGQSAEQIIIESPLVPLNQPRITLAIEQVSPGLLAALNVLSAEGATEETLSDLVLQKDGLSALATFYYYLQKFIDLGMICHTLLHEGTPLATRVPISLFDQFQLKEASIEKPYVLSRFAYCHKDQAQLVLESPLSHAQLILTGWRGAALIAGLATPQTPRELSTQIPGISEETIQGFFSLLLSTEMLSPVQENGKIPEEETETLGQWEFHDLLFHSRSRTGRNNQPFGRTYRFLNQIDPLPAVKPKVSNDTINLYKPDIEKLKQEDSPFTLILEERKTSRSYKDDEPINDKQLGEFLYRSARIKTLIPSDREEISRRPYPNGGAAYELEVYVTINTCENLDPGLYHYCPKDHQLGRISGKNRQVEALLKEAWVANRKRYTPQILLIIAARFQRVSWLYESFAYAGILKNVGILYQNMYLVATAMNLGACALGEGNSDLFAAAAGTDYYAETSVGEFILGSKLMD